MDDGTDAEADEAYGPREVAEYLRSLTDDLARMARQAGLPGTAAALELARVAAESEMARFHPNAAPDDAA